MPKGVYVRTCDPWNKGRQMTAEQRVNSGRRSGCVPWNKGVKTGHAPWLGKNRGPWSAATKAKMRAAALGRKKSAEHAANIVRARMGMKHTAATGLKISRTKIAQGLRGPLSQAWGKSPAHKKRVEYRGIFFRSTFEARFAKALDARGMAWEYEPRRFDLGSCPYLPDFYLPDAGAFWEIKGYYGPDSQMKTRLFREQYPEHPLILATHDVLTMMEGSTNGCRYMEDRSPVGEPGPLAQQCAKRTA